MTLVRQKVARIALEPGRRVATQGEARSRAGSHNSLAGDPNEAGPADFRPRHEGNCPSREASLGSGPSNGNCGQPRLVQEKKYRGCFG
jgi:hypothetical protein